MHRPRRASLALLASVLGAAALPAQALVSRGFELERTGHLEQAAEVYFAAARTDPTSEAALLGLERVLQPLNRLSELLPLARRAAERDSLDGELQALLLRLYVSLTEPDSAALVAARWARSRPGDAAPYREWATALEDRGAFDAARKVLVAGSRVLGEPAAFAVEIGELRVRVGDWQGAARDWASMLPAAPSELTNAGSELGDTPAPDRAAVIEILTAPMEDVPVVRRLAAELLLGWNDPQRAWAVFEPTTHGRSPDAAAALQRFAELASANEGAAAAEVRARALSRFADLVADPLAVRARADAARAYLRSGDLDAARTELQRVVSDSLAPPDALALARTTLIRGLIADGQLDSAAAVLARESDRLSEDDRAALRFALADARIGRGELDRADAVLGDDSSVVALAIRGWVALYRGDLQEAHALFRAAGPYAGDRRAVTERAAMLALTEQLSAPRLPALGQALLLLVRGDSARAVSALNRVASGLAPSEGRGAVLVLAGEVASRLGSDGERTAAAAFAEAVRLGGTGAAPAEAELAWARLLERQGETGVAIDHLEHLILTYPASALVPEARRELERARGAIPRS